MIKKHEDRDNANALVGALDPIPLNLNDTLNIVYNPIYGYLLSSAVVAPAADPGAGENYQVNSSHVLTGNMPGKNLTLTYGLNRDPAYWKTIRYAVVTDTNHNQGSVGGVTSATFLRDDGSSAATGHAHTFGDIKAAGNVATPTPSPVPYYMFDAWYKDPAGTVPVLDTDTFGGDVTLYARFVEDPRYWIDIQLDAAAHGQLAAWGFLFSMLGFP